MNTSSWSLPARSWSLPAGLITLVCLLPFHSAWSEEPPADLLRDTGGAVGAVSQAENSQRVTLDVARDRAKLLHEVYASTLDVMHRRYFHGARAFVPARAMEQVFSDMQRQYQVEASWIAVTLQAMSIDHEPETAFEKEAAEKIRRGELEVELVESGYYRRAVAIPLTGGCVGCHGGFARQSTRKPYAGLVISIPTIDTDRPAARD